MLNYLDTYLLDKDNSEFIVNIYNKIINIFDNKNQPTSKCKEILIKNLQKIETTINELYLGIIDFNLDDIEIETLFNDLNQYEVWFSFSPTIENSENGDQTKLNNLKFNIMTLGYSDSLGNIILF
jgi:response regulator of citrate/malate metabolism